jgi:hypothetical protein
MNHRAQRPFDSKGPTPLTGDQIIKTNAERQCQSHDSTPLGVSYLKIRQPRKMGRNAA